MIDEVISNFRGITNLEMAEKDSFKKILSLAPDIRIDMIRKAYNVSFLVFAGVPFKDIASLESNTRIRILENTSQVIEHMKRGMSFETVVASYRGQPVPNHLNQPAPPVTQPSLSSSSSSFFRAPNPPAIERIEIDPEYSSTNNRAVPNTH